MPVWPDGDAVEFEWTGSGTGSVVAGSALTHRRLPPVANDARSGVYFIRHATLNEWEKSVGTWTNSTQTLTRGEGTIIGSNGAGLVPFTASGLKVVSWVASGNDLRALELFRGGVATITEVPSGAGAYQFNAGGQFNVDITDPEQRALRVVGPSGGALTATMHVVLPDPEAAGVNRGDEFIVRKVDTSTFVVRVVGTNLPVSPTADAGTNAFTLASHGLTAGRQIVLRRGTPPAPLVAGTVYYVVNETASTWQVAATEGGAAIDLTTAGSGFVVFTGRQSLTRNGHWAAIKVGGIGSLVAWRLMGEGQDLGAGGQDIMGAADLGAVRSLLRVTDAAEFTANRTAADADTNLGRLRWQGTTAGRFDVPSGLAVGTDFEVVVDHDLVGIAQLTVERTSGDGNRRLGGPIGCRILRPGGICRVRVVEDGNYITGDLDPAPMAAQNGGASFLLERALKQTVTGGVLQAWGDKYALHNFESLTGSPGVGESGEMSFDQALSDDAFLSESVTFAGTALLFGLAMRIDSVTGSNVIPFTASNFSTGHGFYIAEGGNGTLFVNVMRNASTIIALGSDYILARPFGIGVAINRATGFVYGFFDESQANREREETITSTTFVVDWTSVAQSAQIGPSLSGSQAFAGRVYAATVRDNLTFASVNDARDQAAAMLAEMRGYYA